MISHLFVLIDGFYSFCKLSRGLRSTKITFPNNSCYQNRVFFSLIPFHNYTTLLFTYYYSSLDLLLD